MRERLPSCKGSVIQLRVQLFTVEMAMARENRYVPWSNHLGYVFHDSRGIESGATEEVDILKGFIQTKASADRLQSRLHAIWFGLLCVNSDELVIHIFSGTASRWTTNDQS